MSRLAAYDKTSADRIDYQPIGSAAAIRQIEAGAADFANTDKPLGHAELASARLVQFPELIISGRSRRQRPRRQGAGNAWC